MFYDGTQVKPNMIIGEAFCGTAKTFQLLSAGSDMLVLFVTGADQVTQDSLDPSDNGAQVFPKLENRGFQLKYTFSDAFLPVDTEYRKWHIPGTGKAKRTVAFKAYKIRVVCLITIVVYKEYSPIQNWLLEHIVLLMTQIAENAFNGLRSQTFVHKCGTKTL